jgi:heme/copper-type cytochrome/quinol oxidase subunit 2
MRKLLLVILSMLVTPLFGQDVHQATDLNELLHRIHAGIIQQATSPVTIDAMPAPLAAKTFTVTAQATSGNVASTYQFTVSPTPFVVNQGDSVTLNITVPSTDKSTGGSHGFFLETYFENFDFFINRGQTRTITFVANQPGTFSYICTQSNCGVGHTLMGGTFTVQAVQAAAPSIASISPSSGSPNGGTIVTITGANFANGATVKFDTSSAIGVTVNSSTSITATTPVHAAGNVTVTVTNPDSQSGTGSFTYATPALSITSVSPNTGSTAGGTAVTISGASFQNGATVTFGAFPAPNVTVVNSTTITATTPLGPANDQLAVDVTVTNPDAKSTTQTQGFTYSVPALAIDSVSPSNVITTGGQQITITGAGFTTAATPSVTIGGIAVPSSSFYIVNAVTINAIVPVHAAGGADVVVKMGNNTATKTNGVTYFVFTAPPKRRSAKH